MQNRRPNSRSLVIDENADARVSAFFSISAIMTVVLMVVWVLAPPPTLGVEEGQMAPDIVGEGHSNGNWNDFRLHSHFNHTWEEGEPGQYIFLQFMDTDCGHCWQDALDMTEDYNSFGANGAVLFISVSVGMLQTEHSRGEIVAFQEQLQYTGCYQDENCAERPGDPHPWVYVDDLNLKAFNQYSPPGVPFHLLLSPDGTVVWNSAQHPQGDPLHDVTDAIGFHLSGGV